MVGFNNSFVLFFVYTEQEIKNSFFLANLGIGEGAQQQGRLFPRQLVIPVNPALQL